MKTFVKLKGWFLSFFREGFLYHYSSLEFRAKLLAAMIAIDKKIDECEEKILQEIASQTYKNNEARVYVLINTTKEYVDKVIQKNGLDLNELIFTKFMLIKIYFNSCFFFYYFFKF